MKMNKKSLSISIMVALIVFSTNSAAESCTQRPERAILERLLDLDVAGAETMLLSWPDGVNRQYYEAMVSVIKTCLLYTSPSPRDQRGSRMPSSA